MKTAERGGNGVRAASKAWEQAHRSLCVNACPRGLWALAYLTSQTTWGFSPSRQISEVPFGAELGLNSGF
jgi:hypothetical protein